MSTIPIKEHKVQVIGGFARRCDICNFIGPRSNYELPPLPEGWFAWFRSNEPIADVCERCGKVVVEAFPSLAPDGGA